ncbi:hypothetical protein JJC03_02485 [Flavobacterium oreochromis]|nr:hypothetical protein [Flavobacterium oreochromis]QYS86892.1 hypothetical protein JJC03_02485 [Flavobacterium oreochromis]
MILLITSLLSNCQQNNTNPKKEQMQTIIPKEKQITYAVHINAMTPYELYLDDILIDFFYRDNMNTTVELNPYLLENGTHKLKIRYLPPTDSPDGFLNPKDIIFNKDAKWDLYFVKLNKDPNVPLGYTNEIDYGSSELKIIAPPTKLPFWEQEWDLDIKDLPYKLKGWSESEDLSKMDKDLLEKEVVTFFDNQRNLLNEGKIEEYLNLGKNKNYELDICTYTTEEQSKIDYQDNLELMSKLCFNNMQPINNYEVRLFANGKLITLLIPTGKFKNWSALMSITPKGRNNYYRILLHKPRGLNHFEIIRK